MLGLLLLAAAGGGWMLALAIHGWPEESPSLARQLERALDVHALETALLEEGRLLAGWPVDPDPARFETLERLEAQVLGALERLEAAPLTPDQVERLRRVGDEYARHAARRDRTIEDGTPPEEALDRARVLAAGLAAPIEVPAGIGAEEPAGRQFLMLTAAGLILAAVLAALVGWSYMHGVWLPLRRLAAEARRHCPPGAPAAEVDELEALRQCLERIGEDMSLTRHRLARSQSHLLDAEKLATIGKIAAGVAHEIRSPLTSLRLRLYAIRQQGGGDGDNLRVMAEEVDRLDGIVRNFLEFSRPPELRVQPCNMSLLIDKTLDILNHRIEAAGLAVRREEKPDLPPVMADPQQLRQVLLNLFNNAIEALPAGGTITLSAQPETNGRGRTMVVLRIADDGPGVAEPLRDNLFDPFASGKPDGAGLGLWIGQRIAAQHGGSLVLESNSARGAVFAARVPAVREGGDGPDPGH